MNPEYAIEVTGVKKKFKVYYDKGSSLKERVLFKNRRRHEEHWVLKGIDLKVKKGEAVGLIGKNGCGKSTTLKMLARIMYPTEGSIEMRGRVSSLIELGAGFHPDMSGRENIFTNASIFGLSHREIEKRLDTIIRFSELEDYIDNPVRTYSSGMYMRLAFAVAINVDADILLIDEILAVGDVSFQEKCFEKLKEIKAAGTTVVIVSHVMDQIKNICDRAVWIEEGLVRREGKPAEVSDLYLKEMEQRRSEKIEREFQQQLARREMNRRAAGRQESRLPQDKKAGRNQTPSDKEAAGKLCEMPDFCGGGARREGSGQISFTDAAIRNGVGKQTMFFRVGESMEIVMEYHAEKPGEKINFVVNIARDDGTYCFGTSALSGMGREGAEAVITAGENGRARMIIESCNLLKGRYLVDIGIQDLDENKFDYLYNALEFRVRDEQAAEAGIVHLPRRWEM